MSYCQYILIESQLPINYDMVRMSTHIISFLMMNLENKGCKPMICEVDAYFKSRILNAPKKMTKPELKKWCREYALELLQKRGDTVAYDSMVKAGKQDDMGDVVCYCEGWWKALNEGIQPVKPPIGGFSMEKEAVPVLSVAKPEIKKKKEIKVVAATTSEIPKVQPLKRRKKET